MIVLFKRMLVIVLLFSVIKNTLSQESKHITIQFFPHENILISDSLHHTAETISLKNTFCNNDSLSLSFKKYTGIEFINNENWPLTKLDLSVNYILRFPVTILNFKHLKHLDLTNNLFEILPDSIYKLHDLEWLELGHTPITTLPESFTKLTNLKTLQINYNSIQDKEHFFEILGKLPNLQTLELWSVGGNSDELPESFLKLTKLQTLVLLGSDFNLNTIYQNTTIKNLELQLSALDSIDVNIGKMTNLESLHIIGSYYIKRLPSSLANLEHLTTLIIDDGLGYNHNEMDMDSTYAVITSLQHLQNLVLNHYFEKLFPFYLNKHLKTFTYTGIIDKMPSKKDLLQIKQPMTVDFKDKAYRCIELHKANQYIICK